MGNASSVAGAPSASSVRDGEVQEPSRRLSSNLFLWTHRNSASGNSSVATSRRSAAEPPSAALIDQVERIEDPPVNVEQEERDVQEVQRAGPTESTFSASNRSLLGGLQRRLSNSKLRQQSPVSELWKELELVKRNILSNKPWIDGFSVMWIVLSNTITSVVVAWLFACIYAVGSPVASMFSIPRKQNAPISRSDSQLFSTAIGAYFVAFACVSFAITKSFILTDRLLSAHMTIRNSFRRTLTNYMRVVVHRIVLAILGGVAVMAAMDLNRVDYRAVGRCQLLLLVLVAGSYIDYAVRHARQLRRLIAARIRFESAPENSNGPSNRLASAPSLETIGAALDNSAAVVPASTMSAFRRLSSMNMILRTGSSKTLLHKFVHGYRGFTTLSACAVFGYMHLALALTLEHQWQISLFAAFSLTIKIAIQEATKQLFLSPSRKPSARTTHMIMTLPTVMIDAQIRMVFVQLSLGKSESSSSVFTGSFIIVVCKIFFRLAKILRLRHTIKSRLTHSKGMQRILKRVNSKIAVRDVAVARAEYSQFLDWKNHKLRLHAAEVYADMHGEYVSIGLAMAIVFFFTSHPMFALRGVESQIPRQLVSAAVQLATGLVFDYIASVVEGVHEVPLYEAIGDEGRALRVFMHVLLGALTAVNIGIVAIFLLTSPESV